MALLVTDNGAPATDTTPARATSVKTVVVDPSAAVVHGSVQPVVSMEEVLWGRAIKALPGGGYTALASATTWDDGGTPDDPGDDTRTQTGWVHRFIEPAADIEPLEPGRLLDTRPAPEGSTVDGEFVGAGQVGPDAQVRVQIAGRGGVPAGASAAVLNLTVVAPEAAGFATLYPCTTEPPNASSINYTAGAFVANGVAVQLDDEGYVCLYSLARTHAILDVNAFLPASSGVVPVVPARLLDTRADEPVAPGEHPTRGRVGPDAFVRFKVAGRGGVAADATAALLNVTVVAPEGAGFATVYPCTAEPPTASNVNYQPGVFVANGVIAKLDDEGYVCVYSLARADLVVDVGGYVEQGADVGTLTPARLLEPPPGEPVTAGEHPARVPVGADGSVRVKVAGRGGVDPTATAALLNVTVVSPEGPSPRCTRAPRSRRTPRA